MARDRKAVVWTEERLNWLRKNYKCGNIDKCAEHFGISKNYMSAVACRYKISSGRYLTDKQKKIFEEHPYRSNQYFAKKFGFSEDAIKKMRYTYGIGTIKDSGIDMYTCSEISRIVGRNKDTISKCWCNSGLKYRYVGRYKMIKKKDLFDFMKKYPKKWNALDCEEWFFKNQKWFEEKRKQEDLEMRQHRWGKWYEVV